MGLSQWSGASKKCSRSEKVVLLSWWSQASWVNLVSNCSYTV